MEIFISQNEFVFEGSVGDILSNGMGVQEGKLLQVHKEEKSAPSLGP